MKKIKDIYCVGASHPELRMFDIIIPADCGTTYNAYLLKGEKTALIETVHDSFSEELIANIDEICGVSGLDYIICNHTEPDHSGSLGKLLEINPDITVYGSFAALKNLKNILNRDFKSVTTKNGSSLDLGGYTLNFISAPNLHWPDSIFTYCPELKTVFTCDFLGAHFTGALTDKDVTDGDAYAREFEKYYRFIFGPFGSFVKSGIEILRGLDADTVCPSHGPVVTDISARLADYEKWSEPLSVKGRTAVFYVSAYGYTRAMAEALAEGVRSAGGECILYDAANSSPEELMAAVSAAESYMIGSPTLNRDAVKPVWDVMDMISAVSCRGKKVLIFGSYGWSGEACPNLAARAEGLGLTVFDEPVKICFRPSPEDLDALKEKGKAFMG